MCFRGLVAGMAGGSGKQDVQQHCTLSCGWFTRSAGQPQAERRAVAGPALDADLAVVRLDNPFDDREAEARPAGRAIRLPEAFEDEREVLGRYTAAGVGHGDRDVGRSLPDREADATAWSSSSAVFCAVISVFVPNH